jgi:hypothetical protein
MCHTGKSILSIVTNEWTENWSRPQYLFHIDFFNGASQGYCLLYKWGLLGEKEWSGNTV